MEVKRKDKLIADCRERIVSGTAYKVFLILDATFCPAFSSWHGRRRPGPAPEGPAA